MAAQTDATPTDAAIKAKQRAVWALGDYARVAREIIPALGQALVQASDVRAGHRVLDVAAGSGNAAIPAALTGADVVASDMTPELLDAGRRRAEELGVELTWDQADAEALPYDDDSFDRVLSCVGVMFAPHHQDSADELTRVCRPGGSIGLISWTPSGFVGQMFAAMAPFAPPPPPGSLPPPLWGERDHVVSLLGDRVTDVVTKRQSLRVDRFGATSDFRDYFKTNYGPTIAVYRAIEHDPAKVAALDAALDDLAARHSTTDAVGGGLVMDWEYLLVTARMGP